MNTYADDTTKTFDASSAREWLEAEVVGRSRHQTAEDVRTTCSFARAERLLGREYHGRFLIELLQNAADAWRADERSVDGTRSKVAIWVTDEPALIVANQGAPMTAEVVIESLGHIGASTKATGEAIGHKGIGFKSVLELTLAPEIYSGLKDQRPTLAVRFDPEFAHHAVTTGESKWSDFIGDVQGVDRDDRLSTAPILRFPKWVENVPPAVATLRARGFDTIVRLPFVASHAARLDLSEGQWREAVSGALDGLSDQIILLLDCFTSVEIIHDDGTTQLVQPQWGEPADLDVIGVTAQAVDILRNSEVSSRWRLYRQRVLDTDTLSGELVVGTRLRGEEAPYELVAPTGSGVSAPFHLFFPTRIASGTPLLLHGYFEVDAARTGFYQGSIESNRALLTGLAHLASIAVSDLANSQTIDLSTLVNGLAESGEPDDPLAQEFRDELLEQLDQVNWIPTTRGNSDGARPAHIFAMSHLVTERLGAVFPAAYVLKRVGLSLPSRDLSAPGVELIHARQTHESIEPWEVLTKLCTPGATPIWHGTDADAGFLSLLNLFDALNVEDRTGTGRLVAQLRASPDSRLLPTVAPDGGRALLQVPDPAEGLPGYRSDLLLARARSLDSFNALVPPPELDLAFLPDGLLDSEEAISRAHALGVRPFTVDTVLDRLNGIDQDMAEPERLVRFLWQLLHRERRSSFGTADCAQRAAVFDPSEWFWCKPGRARESTNSRPVQQRERYLSSVPLPCRDGRWRSAGQIGFGADWAAWLASGHVASAPTTLELREQAYLAIDALAPDDAALLAPPSVVLQLLATSASADSQLDGPNDDGSAPDEATVNAERHAFLLRLGVWEVPPLEAFESRDARNRPRLPWDGPFAARQHEQGWSFGLDGWSGDGHRDPYLAEDYRFLWPLEQLAGRDVKALATGIRLGSKLYEGRRDAYFFCTGCTAPGGGQHKTTRASTSADGYPSTLSLQLRHSRWVECSMDGVVNPEPVEPTHTWWHPSPPSGPSLNQSPYRFLPISGPANGITDDLASLARVNRMDTSDVAAIERALLDLRSRFEQHQLPVDPTKSGTARQSFISTHRRFYERLSILSIENATTVHEMLDRTGVLCEIGDLLEYHQRAIVVHDDGSHASFVSRFADQLPFVVLPRDAGTVARRLGIDQFELELARRENDEGVDVTGELNDLLADRVPELLAILVHHSLGTQTLDPGSQQFDERARRLQAIQVRQVSNLIIDASVPSREVSATIGAHSDDDTFLDLSTSHAPVLYFDRSTSDWKARLRPKLGRHLATIVENPAYAATFSLFLTYNTDSEREEFLHELGITVDEVEELHSHVDVRNEEDQARALAWFRAVVSVGGQPGVQPMTLDAEELVDALVAAGYSRDVAHHLVELGGSRSNRSDVSENGVLQLLSDTGISLAALHEALRDLGDEGLVVDPARRRLMKWMRSHDRQLVATLSTRIEATLAKRLIRDIPVPEHCQFEISPTLAEVLTTTVDLLVAEGLKTTPAKLAEDGAEEIARLGGFPHVEGLDRRVLEIYDPEEQRRALRERASRWCDHLRLLAVMARTSSADTRASIRRHGDAVAELLGTMPEVPSDLIGTLEQLFPDAPGVALHLESQLVDQLSAPSPDRLDVLRMAEIHGIDTAIYDQVRAALEAPRRKRAERTARQIEQLVAEQMGPTAPPGLLPPPTNTGKTRPEGKPGTPTIRTVHVDQTVDRRKREVGEEGEEWALAAVVGELTALGDEERYMAIEELRSFLDSRFNGEPIRAALPHAERALSLPNDEELIDELLQFVHVSRHSDAFGFDVLGWVQPSENRQPHAMCLEVKNSSDGSFHLSNGEWKRAEWFRDTGEGDRYAVLVVRRDTTRSVPAAMDLLVDPVGLAEAGLLVRTADGYKVSYRPADKSSPSAPEKNA